MTENIGSARPTWGEYWETIGNEQLLAAKALLELSVTVRRDVENWLRWQHDEAWTATDGTHIPAERWADLDWDGWAADVDERGRPFSSTEGRLVELVAALAARRPLQLDGVFNLMGSWETDVWRILTEWGTGGDNRDRAGRATVTTRRSGGGW